MQTNYRGIISNPNLAPYIKQSVLAYQQAGMLMCFFTTFCVTKKWASSFKYLPHSLEVFLNRRGFKQLNDELLKSGAFTEILRVLATKLGNANLADEIWEWSEKRFDKRVSKKLNSKTAFFHGYEHASLNSLRSANNLGITTFYEQPSQHHQYFTKVVEEQIKEYPSLKNNAIVLLNDKKAKKRNQRRDEELRLSDYIICNSSFTKRTLVDAGIATEKILVIPYGYPATRPILEKKKDSFHFIYAGNLSLRKGIHILLEAWKKLPDDLPVFLTLMGNSQLPSTLLSNLPKNIIWIPNLPYEMAQEKIAESNMLILPTLADGFGMVISESMAMGVPVLTTTASGGPDLIESYTDGIIVPPDNVQLLANAITWCANHVDECLDMGQKAQEKAKAYPWPNYRKKLIEEVKKRLNGQQ